MSANAITLAISGFSGRYAKCDNPEQFIEALLNGDDLITTDHPRWPHEALIVPNRIGMIKDIEYFDAEFFGLTPSEARCSDIRLRKVLEVIFEAIIDAGLNPTEMRGTNTAVVFAASPSYHATDLGIKVGTFGFSPSLMANRISYIYDFKGPSYSIDTACSSGLYALNEAADLIRGGKCEMAIVCGTQFHLDPFDSIEFFKFGVLNEEGKCKVYDLHRNGYVKADGVVAIVLQNVTDCRRIYAEIVGTGVNVDGFKEVGPIHPSHIMQVKMLQDTYSKYNVNPMEVNYMESHGTGTVVGDAEESQAIDEFFCKNRKFPLLLGSVKSNHGHSETASALVSLSKILLSIHGGTIPANLNYKVPDPELKGIYEGRLKVIDKNTPLPNGLIAVNAFGFGGANGTAILRPYNKRNQIVNELSHRLVCISGRTEEAVNYMLGRIIDHKSNGEFLALIDHIFKKPIQNHIYRGFTILSDNSLVEVRKIEEKRSIWFVYPSLGSQWNGSCKELMKIEIFRTSIQKCIKIIKPYGINLEEIIMSGSLNHTHHILVASVAISIALTDTLTWLGVEPEGIIGHSIGEIACAYADNLISLEQAMLLAYSWSYAISSTNLKSGLMAVIGLGLDECEKRLPKDLFVACDNSDDNVTIAGSEDSMQKFLDHLKNEGIFNKILDTAGITYNCPNIASGTNKMYEFAKTVIPVVREKSDRWISSTIPESDWDKAIHCCGDYFKCNFSSRVHFRQTLKYIPENSVVIEMAPAQILQNILKRSLGGQVTILNFTSYEKFLSNIGKLYNAGSDINLTTWYNSVKFPISLNTPTISNLIKWDHSKKWTIPKFSTEYAFGNFVEIDLRDEDNHFLENYKINGKVTFPVAGYIILVWHTIARMAGKPHDQVPVIIEDMKIHSSTFLPKNDKITFVCNILNSTGYFEIRLKSSALPSVTGKISIASEDILEDSSSMPNQFKSKIGKEEFYEILSSRGYHPEGVFESVQLCGIDGDSAIVQWNDNWMAFLDGIIQVVLCMQYDSLYVPEKISKIIINPLRHLGKDIAVTYDQTLNVVTSNSCEMRKIQGRKIKKNLDRTMVKLSQYKFIPNHGGDGESANILEHTLHLIMEIVAENHCSNTQLQIGQVSNFIPLKILNPLLKNSIFSKINVNNSCNYYDLLIISDITKENDHNILTYCKNCKFLFTKIEHFDNSFFDTYELEIIFKIESKSGTYVLTRSSQKLPENYIIILANNQNFYWLEELRQAVDKYQNTDDRIYLVSDDSDCGIIGFFNSVKMECWSRNLRIFLLRNGEEMERFSIRSKFYTSQLRKDLTVNVYQNSWGTYRSLPLSPPQKQLCENVYCVKIDNGTKTGLQWLQISKIHKNSISVHYTGLNKIDLSDLQNGFGLEYSGFDDKNNRVLGLCRRALASMVTRHPQLTWKIPNKWSLEQAATVPLAYTLSYYGLFLRGRLSPNDSILIHNTSTDVSLAAITLVLQSNSTMYLMVNSLLEKELLVSTFPTLPENNIIINSKKKPFQEMIFLKTKGKGVSLVFNCNSDQLISDSMECASKNCRFIEFDYPLENQFLACSLFENYCNYANVTIADIFNENCGTLEKIFYAIKNLLEAGAIQPLPFKIYYKNEIGEALENMENGVKCLIQMKRKPGFFFKPDNRILAVPQTLLHPTKCYIVVNDGSNGFALELIDWIICRGATKIIFNTGKSKNNGNLTLYSQKWKQQQIVVLIDNSDISTLEGAEDLLNFSRNVGQIGGIFNMAFTDDAHSIISSCQNINSVFTQNLDYFVTFASSGIKSESYAFAISALECICESRQGLGLNALLIKWESLDNDVMNYYTSCLEVLDQMLEHPGAVIVGHREIFQSEIDKSGIDTIAEILGLEDIEIAQHSSSLSELGIDPSIVEEIQYLLARHYAIYLDVDEITNSTFLELNKICNEYCTVY